ncbi:MAG: pilus assembly protein TadG-related protein, partial [Pseudomonadota bacterium]
MTVCNLKRFWRDDSAAAMIFFGIAIVPLVGAIGVAVDMARWSNATSQTKQAADAAVLAGVSVLRSGETAADAIAVAERVYASNTANRIPLKTDTMAFTVNDQGTSVTAVGDAVLDATALKV